MAAFEVRIMSSDARHGVVDGEGLHSGDDKRWRGNYEAVALVIASQARWIVAGAEQASARRMRLSAGEIERRRATGAHWGNWTDRHCFVRRCRRERFGTGRARSRSRQRSV